MSAENKISLITGAKVGGIGFEVARLLAPDGVVYLTSRDENDAVKSAKLLEAEGLNVEPAGLDVTQVADFDAVVEKAAKRYGNINVAVHCATVFDMKRDREKSILDLDLDDYDRVHNVGARGFLILVKKVLPGMIDEDYGRLVQVYGSWGSPDRIINDPKHIGNGVGYGTSKTGEHAEAMFAAKMLNNQGVKGVAVFSVDPGRVETGMNPTSEGTRKPSEAAYDILKAIDVSDASLINGKLLVRGVSVSVGSYTKFLFDV